MFTPRCDAPLFVQREQACDLEGVSAAHIMYAVECTPSEHSIERNYGKRKDLVFGGSSAPVPRNKAERK